jgi:YidC/Oxa1 family membrane protein insertase
MDQKRLILYIALLFVIFSLWQAWQQDYHTPATQAETQATPVVSSDAPPLSAQKQAQAATAATEGLIDTTTSDQSASAGQMVTVSTDTVNAVINTQGGNIVKLDLRKYPTALETPDDPEPLLDNTSERFYIAQSGLIGAQGPDSQEKQAIYSTEQSSYTLAPSQESLPVKLSWTNEQGLTVNKTFTFKRGQYDVNVEYKVENNTDKPWSGQFYAQLKQKEASENGGIFSLHTYTGGSISTADKKFEKVKFSDMKKKNLDVTTQGGWLAMQERYFLTSWIPDASQTNHYYSRANGDVYTLGYVGPVITAEPGQNATANALLYAGPETGGELSAIAPNLDLTIDYGWLWPISAAIFWAMKHIHSVVGNWGWSIVLVTLLIKILFYKLSEKSYRSMAQMRKLAPKMQALKERYGDDRQKMSQATMEMYRKEKINPLSGCLPMLVQIPFFIALYYVLIESVELRQSPFIFWIHDLAVRDPYFVLPLLMGLSMFLQQKLSPKPPDPMQARIMMMLPIMFTVFFLFFPAGLVLYWLTNNILSILQQWYIMRKVEKQENGNGKVMRMKKA